MPEFSKQQVKEFNQNGFVVAPALADQAMLKALRSQVESERSADPLELEAEVGYPGAPRDPAAPGGQTPRRLLQAYQRGGALATWAGDGRVVQRVGQLLDSRRLLLSQAHHNCVMTKFPSYSSDTLWHQDIRYWSFAPPVLVNCWLALGDERQDNGGLRVISGSHRWQMSADRLDEGQFLRTDCEDNRRGIEQAEPVDLNAGDVLFFSAALFHCASRNATNEVKLSVVYSYHGSAVQALPGTRSASLPEIQFVLP